MTEQQKKWGNTLPQKGDWVLNGSGVIIKLNESPRIILPRWEGVSLANEVVECIQDFEFHGYGRLYSHSLTLDFIALCYGNGMIFDSEGNWAVGISHLHHLQQLYRLLTGNELAIDWKS